MKCPHCRWTGSFKSYGSHQASKHRRIMLKNLRKAHTPAARAKAAATRRRKLQEKSPHHRGSRKESTKAFAEGHTGEIVAAMQAFPSHFCPVCGRRCG